MDSAEAKNYSEEEIQALIQSTSTVLMNKVKLIMHHSRKNRQLAQNQHLINLVDLIAE
jgi:hypothetical protein